MRSSGKTMTTTITCSLIPISLRKISLRVLPLSGNQRGQILVVRYYMLSCGFMVGWHGLEKV